MANQGCMSQRSSNCEAPLVNTMLFLLHLLLLGVITTWDTTVWLIKK